MSTAAAGERDAQGLEQRLRLLSELAREFSAATDHYDVLLSLVTRRLSETFGDLCAIRLLSADGLLIESVGAVHHPDPAMLVIAGEVVSSHPQRVGEGIAGQVAATGKSVLIPEVDTAQLLAKLDPERRPSVARMNISSLIVVPLVSRGRVIGVVSLSRSDSQNPLDERDLNFLEDLAAHAALAITSSRLLAAAQTELAERERMTARFRVLAEASHDFSEATGDYGRLLAAIARRVGETVGDLCFVRAIDDHGTMLDAGVAYHRDPRVLARVEGLTAGRPLRMGETVSGKVAASGKAVFMPSTSPAEYAEATSPEYGELVAWLDVGGAIVVPMLCRAKVVGVITVLRSRSESAYTLSDFHFVESLAGHAALAIANARSYAAERLARAAAVTANQTLHESEEAHRLLFEASPVPLLVFDIETLSPLAVNQRALDLYGYEREEFMQMNLSALAVHGPEISRARLSAWGDSEANGTSQYRRKDGSRFFAEFTTRVLSFAGRGARISVIKDLTERYEAQEALRRTEEQLRQAQKMEAVGRLAGGIAHDFNNLLTVILSYGDTIASDLAPGDPIRQDVEQIRRAAARAADLTRQLLMFSRQQVVEPKVLALNDLLAAMEPMLRRILGEDVELTLSLAPRLGSIRADPSSVEQVVMNLVVNARDAMPTGGKLTIETGDVELDEHHAQDHLGSSTGPHVMLAVTDTGTGMDAETRARIFDPFFTTKEPGRGTGLGLSTVFGITQQSGASIWVHSEPGRGATFKIYFPRIETKDVTLPPPRASQAPRGSEVVLLVEDQEQVRNVAAAILRRQGFRVMPAESAPQALLLAEKEGGQIDLLLTDVVMPQMSGAELVKRIAVSRPKIRVLFMSGYTDDSVVRHGVLESGLAFLQKPFTPESLIRKVREVLSVVLEPAQPDDAAAR